MAIRNNQVVSEVGHRTKDWASGFREFILRGNVVDLAIGIMIGVAFTAVVNGLVSDIITPLIPLPSGNLSTLTWPLPYSNGVIRIGAFINVLITFLTIALVIYFFIVRPMNALTAHQKRKEAKEHPDTRDCPYCLNSVPYMATRCGHCTSPLPAPQQPPKAR